MLFNLLYSFRTPFGPWPYLYCTSVLRSTLLTPPIPISLTPHLFYTYFHSCTAASYGQTSRTLLLPVLLKNLVKTLPKQIKHFNK